MPTCDNADAQLCVTRFGAVRRTPRPRTLPQPKRNGGQTATVSSRMGITPEDYAGVTSTVTVALTSGCSRTETGWEPTVLMWALGSSTRRLSSLGPPAAVTAAT